jgi:hypothetical protein
MFKGESRILLSPNGNLELKGNMGAKDICVTSDGSWCDFVFDEKYKLMDIDTLKTFIRKNHHYPSISTATDIAKNGITVSKMFKAQMQMQEEHILYTLQMHDKLSKLENIDLKKLKNENILLKKRLNEMENKLNELIKK